MASIFLSYARDDAAKAAKIAAALEAAGHEVWWDRHIGAGTRFAAEIEEALKAADRVVTLWSKTSIRSAWVLDEAAAGRDTGRLIPVLIEAVEPPLGFRQYQSVEALGGGKRAFAALIAAVAESPIEDQSAAPPVVRSKRGKGLPKSAIAAMFVALLAVALGGWWWINRGSPGAGNRISVVAADGRDSGPSAELARSLALDLGQYRAGPMGNLTIFEPGDAGAAKADYRLEIGLSGGGADQHAEVALKSGDGSGVLWSTLTKGETGKLVDLHQQVAAQIGDLLDCLVRLDSKERAIDQASLALYLNACSNDGQTEQAAGVYRQLTNKSPQFAPGWGGLAVTLAMGVDFSHSAKNAALVADARQALAKAKQLDPSLEENFVAEANLNPSGERDPGRELRLYDAGLKLHPDSAGLRGLRSQSLMSLGRMSEAIVDSDRALELNPISPSAREAYISALAYSGRSEAAFAKLREAEATWPGSQRFEDLRYNLNLRFGDARAAQDYLRRNGNIASTQGAQSWMAFLDARLRPGAAEIDRALDAFRGRYRINHAQVIGYVQAMGTFGRYDEAYQILQLPESANALRQGSEVLFRPFMKGFRDDPRFMMLAKRIGLVDEWQSSGVWPDFCGEADLPYNCRAEAAKLKSVPKPTS